MIRAAWFFSLIPSLLFASVPPSPTIEIESKWSVIGRKGHPWEMQPHEYTKPVVVGDIIYFANLDGVVSAYHRIEGYVLWTKTLPGGVQGALSYGRSKLYVGDIKGNLYALNSRDGSQAWHFKTNSPWGSPPLVVRDRVFAATIADELYALSESKGEEIWHFSQRGDEKMTVKGTSAPVNYGNEIYQGFSDGHLVALSMEQGRVIWQRRLRSRERFYDVDTTPFVDDKRVIAGTFDGKIYSLDRTTGDTLWFQGVGAYGGFHVDDKSVYFAGLDGNLYAVKKDSGETVWKKPFQKGVGLAPVKVGDYLVVTTSGDPVYVVDPINGDIKATTRLGAGTLAAAASTTGDSWFYCISNYGNLFSFELKKSLGIRRAPETIPGPSAILGHVRPGTKSGES